ncbi:hypothetical protein Tco_0050548, partial [Tanacetum coccineum]
MAAVNDGQRRRTTVGPPVNHWSMVVDGQSTGGPGQSRTILPFLEQSIPVVPVPPAGQVLHLDVLATH